MRVGPLQERNGFGRFVAKAAAAQVLDKTGHPFRLFEYSDPFFEEFEASNFD